MANRLKRGDLKAYSGYSVQIVLDGKEEAVTLNAENPEKAFLDPVKTSTSPNTEWTNMDRYYLTDDDIAGLIPSGPNNLFSRISLTSPSSSASN
jgi:hypothetical protein